MLPDIHKTEPIPLSSSAKLKVWVTCRSIFFISFFQFNRVFFFQPRQRLSPKILHVFSEIPSKKAHILILLFGHHHRAANELFFAQPFPSRFVAGFWSTAMLFFSGNRYSSGFSSKKSTQIRSFSFYIAGHSHFSSSS
ncbi:hypothetical protein AXF13_08130 [Desulfovibrio fairfieldensis]|uniref:Uncharacterized protein n=1 Tax=Desulfovibrio fairfieldensis TaxID=44742 RepID=A0A0X8JJT5_9BACT|nr:hypothetical protein AXF13_08130 [Desulfovibrio fairfieldensis]